MDPAYIKSLHDLLAQTVAPDTNVIKNATATLNSQYYKDPTCIPALFEILASSPEQSIRQLAAVELRKRISQKDGKLWLAVGDGIRTTIKSKSLETILVEPAAIVRHSTARVISAIANLELGENAWPQLLPFLYQATVSPTAAHREIGVYVLYSVIESVVEALKEQTSQLLALFAKLLVDPQSAEVRVTTVKALGTLSQYIEPTDKADIKTFQGLLPQIFSIVNEVCVADDEANARDVFEAIETLLIIETPLLAKNIPELVQFCLTIGANKDIEDPIRMMALNALSWAIKYKKSKIQSLGLAKPILEMLMPIGAEPDPEDADEETPSRVAFRNIDALATVLPPQQVFPPLHAIVTSYMQSPDAGNRKAALMAFGVTVEGCSEFIKPHMDSLWPLFDAGLQDSSPLVRKAACMSFACACEWMEEQCASRHAVLLPVIIHLTNDPDTQQAACAALDAYLEILETEIKNYLPMIMDQLSRLLANAPNKVKSVVTGAIGSAAHASKTDFAPYFQQTIEYLRNFLTLTGEGEEQELRGITMDAVGAIAEAVGKDTFRPHMQDMMSLAFGGVGLGSARMKECSFIFFGVVAKVFEDEFAPYVASVAPLLIESLGQSEGEDDALIDAIIKNNPEAFSTTGDTISAAVDLMDGEAQAGGVDPAAALSVNSAIAIEKEIAAETMGTLFAATTTAFLEYLEASTLALLSCLDHYYEGIRKSAIGSLFEFIRTFYDMSESPLWEPGAQVSVPLHDKVRDLATAIMVPIMKMWDQEDDKGVVSVLCQALTDTLAKVGPGLLQGSLKQICEQIQLILEGKSLCQQDPDADEDDEPLDEQAEFDAVLISAAFDVVSALASVLGADFAQVFSNFLPLITKYAGKTRSSGDRSSAMGTLGEIITGMKEGITPFTEAILNASFGALSDEDPEVRSNAAYTLGVLVENSTADTSANHQFLHMLNGLKPMFAVSSDADPSVLHGRDNAAGAVSRMILKNSAALPLDQVLPVLYGALPLRNDYLENTPVYRAIFHLFRANSPVVMTQLDTLLPVFAVVLSSSEDEITPEIKAELVQLVQHLNQQVPDKVSAAGLTGF